MKVCKTICNQCPFAKKSAPGWLGPHSVDDILHAIQFDVPFSCHLHRKEDSAIDDIMKGDLPICRGFLATAKKSCKLFGQNTFGKHLRPLQDEITDEDVEQVMNKWEFKQHHEKYNQ